MRENLSESRLVCPSATSGDVAFLTQLEVERKSRGQPRNKYTA
jgi:hypothetical protein